MLELIFLVFLVTKPSNASSWEECHFQARFISYSGDEIQLLVEKHIGGDGMHGDPGLKVCGQFVGSIKIPAKDLGPSPQTFTANEELKLSRTHYSAMGPHGPMNSTRWRLLGAIKSGPKKN